MNTSIKLKHIILSTLLLLIALPKAFSQSVTILPKLQTNADTLSTRFFRMTEGAGMYKVMLSDDKGNGIWAPYQIFTDAYWTLNDTYQLYLATSSNLGVGTDSPAYKLDVKNTASPVIANFSGSSTIGAGIRLSSGVSGSINEIPVSTEWQIFHSGSDISNENGGNGQLHFKDQEGTRMILRNNGRVGIGVTNPSEMLEVDGNARINGRIDIRNTGSSVFIGEEAGENDDLTGNYNTFVGFFAGKANVGGGDNVGIGAGSLENNVSGRNNTALGRLALVNNISGESNVALGIYAGANAGGNNNVFLGAHAGDDNTGGNNNVFLGTHTGNNATGSFNTFLGANAGGNSGGSYNVFLGKGAGEDEQGNDKLYIHNSNTTTPLIYGDFVQRNLGVNGRLIIGAHTPLENASKLDVSATQDARFIVQSWAPTSYNTLIVARLLSSTNVAPQLRFERAGNNYVDIGQDSNGSFVVGGGENPRLAVESSGQVGIGTKTPASQLEIVSTAKETLEAASSSTVGTWFSLKNSSSGGKKWHFISTGSANTEVKGSLLIKEEDTARMFIETATGEVGFGTVTPNSQLEVSGTGNEMLRATSSSTTGTWFSLLNTSTGGNNWKMISTGSANGEGVGHLILKDNTGTKVFFKSNGAVGIGTSTPTQAKLVINGSLSNNLSYGYLNSNGSTSTASGTNSYSIYTTDRIATSEVNVYSDERIKKVKGLSDNASDLATLMNIQITNYQLIDSISKGNTNYKKVVAQQVEEVYPSAVTKITDFVPDIYQLSSIEKGFIPLTKTTLKAGDKLKLISEEKQETVEVLSVSVNGIQVNSDRNGKVFVYGREVNDFRTVDYEALTTLNISATQQLLKRIEILEKENQRINQLAQEIESLKNILLVSQKGK